MKRIALALALALPCLLVVPSAAAAQGGAAAPDLSDPCPAACPGDGAAKRRIARWMARVLSGG